MNNATVNTSFNHFDAVNILMLLRVKTTDTCFEIGAITPKAIMIKFDDRKHSGNGGEKSAWLPKSLMSCPSFNMNRDNSQHGIFEVELPEWFIHQNRKNIPW